MSTRLLAFEIPALFTNSKIADGVYPLRLKPHSVGILGSSQPSTVFVSTSSLKYLFDITVYVTLRRANSLCFGGNSKPTLSTTHS